MYHIIIEGDGKTTHETQDIKKAKAFVINAIRSVDNMANFSVKVSEQTA